MKPMNATADTTLKTGRNSNLELFRIVTMFLIVAHHYVVNSGITVSIYADPFSARSLFLLLFGAWGKTGINCFVLITGYFMCKSKITVKKFLKLLVEVLLYRCVIYVLFCVFGYEKFNIISFIARFWPIKSVDNGFTSCYFIFFLLIPFLNILIQQMTEKQHIRLLLLCVLVYVVFGTIPSIPVTMNYVSWFCVLYFIASYIRLYPKKLFDNTALWGWISLLMLFLASLTVVACAWLSSRLHRDMAYYLLSDSNKVFAVLVAVCGFMFFKNIRIKQNRFINATAMTMYGVLLIHANDELMRQWLWRDVLKVPQMYTSPWLVVHAIVSVVLVFSVCSVIDYLRIKCIETPLFRLYDKPFSKVSGWFSRIEDKWCDKLNISKE